MPSLQYSHHIVIDKVFQITNLIPLLSFSHPHTLVPSLKKSYIILPKLMHSLLLLIIIILIQILYQPTSDNHASFCHRAFTHADLFTLECVPPPSSLTPLYHLDLLI